MYQCDDDHIIIVSKIGR